MKHIWKYILMGCLVALGGMIAAEFAGDIFSGMNWGSAAIVGICMYLCIVVVTCTGLVLEKLKDLSAGGKGEEEAAA